MRMGFLLKCAPFSLIAFFFTLKGSCLRENKNKLKKSRLSPDPVKRAVGEI